MNATINAPCEHGWPARECDRHDDPPASYRAPLLIRVIATIGYLCLGANIVILGRLAWNVARGLAGGGW